MTQANTHSYFYQLLCFLDEFFGYARNELWKTLIVLSNLQLFSVKALETYTLSKILISVSFINNVHLSCWRCITFILTFLNRMTILYRIHMNTIKLVLPHKYSKLNYPACEFRICCWFFYKATKKNIKHI